MKRYLVFAACGWIACLSGLCLALSLSPSLDIKLFGIILFLFGGMSGYICGEHYRHIMNIAGAYRSLLGIKNGAVRFLCGLSSKELKGLIRVLTPEELTDEAERTGAALAELKDRKRGRPCKKISQLENILIFCAFLPKPLTRNKKESLNGSLWRLNPDPANTDSCQLSSVSRRLNAVNCRQVVKFGFYPDVFAV
mgnify:CR=1 FL=1